MNKERVLVIAHGHPAVNKGGGELAAYNLFLGLKQHPKVEKAVFIGRAEPVEGQSTPFGQWAEDGLLFHSRMGDFFLLAQENKPFVWREFRSFLESFKPTIVHFHHYIHLGLEMLREVKNYSKSCKLVLTLHEYQAICFNAGQMVKTEGNKLCKSASPRECHACFPHIDSGNFLLREHYVKSFFELVDAFVSPSNFLIDRYVSWGLEKDKFKMIENGHPEQKKKSSARPQSEKVVLGFFGQINPYKGIDVLLDAIEQLPKSIKDQVEVQLNGANLQFQTEEFRQKVEAQLKKLKKIVKYQGAYEPEDQFELMQLVDWVVIPSIWWENAPMVIQEAFNAGRPIICSNIGGMAEKVEDGKTGIHFIAGKSADLAAKIEHIVTHRELQAKYVQNIVPAQTIENCTTEHMALYAAIS